MTPERPMAVPEDHERFAHDDAAWLFGALDEDQRVDFEEHLERCPACRRSVGELRDTVSALAPLRGLPESALSPLRDLPDEDPVPSRVPAGPAPDLLPGLLERAAAENRQESRRVHRVVAGLGGIAAAALIAVGVALAFGHSPAAPGHATVTAAAMSPVDASVPMRATAQLAPAPWGTRITLHCHYTAGSYRPGAGAHVRYRLRVVDARGRGHDLGSWSMGDGSGRSATFTSGTSLDAGQIRQLQVRTDAGVVLRLRR